MQKQNERNVKKNSDLLFIVQIKIFYFKLVARKKIAPKKENLLTKYDNTVFLVIKTGNALLFHANPLSNLLF